MIVDGMIASYVKVSKKGVSFQVMCISLGNTFKVFIPTDKVNGEQFLKMRDIVKVDLNELFSIKNEVRMEVKSVVLDKE